MNLLSAAALFLITAAAFTSCEKDAAAKNDISEPLTAQELARILHVHTWKIKINKIPADAEWLQMVVLDKDGTIIQRGNSMGLASLRDANKPLDLLIGLEMKDGNASVFFSGNGGSSYFTMEDPLDEKARGTAGKSRGSSTSDGSEWDGSFLQLMSDSPTVGVGPKPFYQATRIIALHYRTEKDPSQP